MTLTLQRIAENVRTAQPLYMVAQRANGHWSPAAKILGTFDNEADAEHVAADQKRTHPSQHFGVFALRSEARVIPDPIEIVRVPE